MNRRIASRTPLLRPLAASLALACAASCLHATERLPLHGTRAHAEAALAAGHRQPSGIIVVTSCDDSGPGTLREAYFNAVDGDTIDLTELTCSRITLTSGALTDSPSAASVAIQGNSKYEMTIDGGHSNRVLVHNGSYALELYGVTITAGSYVGQYGGGCIYSYGDVLLEGVNVTDCSLASSGTDHAFGGAIYARDQVLVIASTVADSTAHAPQGNSAGGGVFANRAQLFLGTLSGNTVTGDGSHYARGGGLYSLTETTIENSTINGNSAETGGGVFLIGATSYTLLVSDSTISGNHSEGAAGGLYAKYAPLQINNSTITANTAVFDFGAGAYLQFDTDLESTIVAGNTSEDGLRTSDIGGHATIIGSNNLVIDSTLPLPADTLSVDPMLGPLQDNGGLTHTHALLPGSPAIDHGNNVANIEVDQRAFDETVAAYERVVGPSADIGAFEFGAPDRIFEDGFEL